MIMLAAWVLILVKSEPGLTCVGLFVDVDQELVEVGGGDDGGAVGFELQLHLGDFESDGFGDVGGGGGKEQGDARTTSAKGLHR